MQSECKSNESKTTQTKSNKNCPLYQIVWGVIKGMRTFTKNQLLELIKASHALEAKSRRVGEILSVYRAFGILFKTTEGRMSFQYRAMEGLLDVFTIGQNLMDPATFVQQYHSQETPSDAQRERFQTLCNVGFTKAFGSKIKQGWFMQSFRFFILTTLGAEVAWTSKQIDLLCAKPKDKSRARTGILKVCETLTSTNGARLFEIGEGNKANCRWIGATCPVDLKMCDRNMAVDMKVCRDRNTPMNMTICDMVPVDERNMVPAQYEDIRMWNLAPVPVPWKTDLAPIMEVPSTKRYQISSSSDTDLTTHKKMRVDHLSPLLNQLLAPICRPLEALANAKRHRTSNSVTTATNKKMRVLPNLDHSSCVSQVTTMFDMFSFPMSGDFGSSWDAPNRSSALLSPVLKAEFEPSQTVSNHQVQRAASIASASGDLQNMLPLGDFLLLSND